MRVALVGRPNVGKSTLFNKLCKKKLAIIDSIPGVTRDVREHVAILGDLRFTLLDTAGWEEHAIGTIAKLAIKKAVDSAVRANVVLLLLDGKEHISNDDLALVSILREVSRHIVLVVNKSEAAINIAHNDLYALGLGAPIFISAEHMLGLEHLYSILKDIFINLEQSKNLSCIEESQTNAANSILVHETYEPAKFIKCAIVGKPNVGKSTLFNALLGFERNIVCEEAGTTRDAVYCAVTEHDTTIVLIDTAGMRKKAKVYTMLENTSIAQSITAIRCAHVVVLVIDATCGLNKQDIAIAQIAYKEGKGILLVLNKCDLLDVQEVKKVAVTVKQVLYDVSASYILEVSALRRKNVKLIKGVMRSLYDKWKSTIPTGRLNNWLQKAIITHTPPVIQHGVRLKLKYITQISSKPPTFQLFVNFPLTVPGDYSRYLTNSIKEHFRLCGIPVRLNFASSNNPYARP